VFGIVPLFGFDDATAGLPIVKGIGTDATGTATLGLVWKRIIVSQHKWGNINKDEFEFPTKIVYKHNSKYLKNFCSKYA